MRVAVPEIGVVGTPDGGAGAAVGPRTGRAVRPGDPHTAATLGCDPVARDLAVDGDGNPLRLGLARRFASPDQRRAAAVRDGGCVFPGCDAPPSWTDLHHVHHWQTGGSTDLANLARRSCNRFRDRAISQEVAAAVDEPESGHR